MSKSITFSYGGTDYTLLFTKATRRRMENNGFDLDSYGAKTLTVCERLFSGSFLARHPFAKQETIDEIFSAMPDKDKLLEKLVDMYQEPLVEMLQEPDETKKVQWEASF